MTSMSNDTGSFAPRCLSPDLEVVEDGRIRALIRRGDVMFLAGLVRVRRRPPFPYDTQAADRNGT